MRQTLLVVSTVTFLSFLQNTASPKRAGCRGIFADGFKEIFLSSFQNSAISASSPEPFHSWKGALPRHNPSLGNQQKKCFRSAVHQKFLEALAERALWRFLIQVGSPSAGSDQPWLCLAKSGCLPRTEVPFLLLADLLPSHPPSEKGIFPNVQSECPKLQYMAIVASTAIWHYWNELVSAIFTSPWHKGKGIKARQYISASLYIMCSYCRKEGTGYTRSLGIN